MFCVSLFLCCSFQELWVLSLFKDRVLLYIRFWLIQLSFTKKRKEEGTPEALMLKNK